MFNFFDKVKNKNIEDPITKIAALLIHVAKIDENYTEKEREIIKKAINDLGSNNEVIDDILIKAEEIEKNSNQILDFTKEVKNMDKDSKIKIVEVLWNIIYSDNSADMYENSLMRRLTGLLYLDTKIVGNIKNKIINNLK
tara:strand:+ start:156 stop:575 length:420 start_codon:yes stop_codon:yes gene_type:complete